LNIFYFFEDINIICICEKGVLEYAAVNDDDKNMGDHGFCKSCMLCRFKKKKLLRSLSVCPELCRDGYSKRGPLGAGSDVFRNFPRGTARYISSAFQKEINLQNILTYHLIK
jgi:hypothetical protein